jgi:hypothetical protein
VDVLRGATIRHLQRLFVRRQRLCHERKALTAERVRHVNRIKGFLFSQGVSGYQPLRRDRCRLFTAHTHIGHRPVIPGASSRRDRGARFSGEPEADGVIYDPDRAGGAEHDRVIRGGDW